MGRSLKGDRSLGGGRSPGVGRSLGVGENGDRSLLGRLDGSVSQASDSISAQAMISGAERLSPSGSALQRGACFSLPRLCPSSFSLSQILKHKN